MTFEEYWVLLQEWWPVAPAIGLIIYLYKILKFTLDFSPQEGAFERFFRWVLSIPSAVWYRLFPPHWKKLLREIKADADRFIRKDHIGESVVVARRVSSVRESNKPGIARLEQRTATFREELTEYITAYVSALRAFVADASVIRDLVDEQFEALDTQVEDKKNMLAGVMTAARKYQNKMEKVIGKNFKENNEVDDEEDKTLSEAEKDQVASFMIFAGDRRKFEAGGWMLVFLVVFVQILLLYSGISTGHADEIEQQLRDLRFEATLAIFFVPIFIKYLVFDVSTSFYNEYLFLQSIKPRSLEPDVRNQQDSVIPQYRSMDYKPKQSNQQQSSKRVKLLFICLVLALSVGLLTAKTIFIEDQFAEFRALTIGSSTPSPDQTSFAAPVNGSATNSSTEILSNPVDVYQDTLAIRIGLDFFLLIGLIYCVYRYNWPVARFPQISSSLVDLSVTYMVERNRLLRTVRRSSKEFAAEIASSMSKLDQTASSPEALSARIEGLHKQCMGALDAIYNEELATVRRMPRNEAANDESALHDRWIELRSTLDAELRANFDVQRQNVASARQDAKQLSQHFEERKNNLAGSLLGFDKAIQHQADADAHLPQDEWRSGASRYLYGSTILNSQTLSHAVRATVTVLFLTTMLVAVIGGIEPFMQGARSLMGRDDVKTEVERTNLPPEPDPLLSTGLDPATLCPVDGRIPVGHISVLADFSEPLELLAGDGDAEQLRFAMLRKLTEIADNIRVGESASFHLIRGDEIGGSRDNRVICRPGAEDFDDAEAVFRTRLSDLLSQLGTDGDTLPEEERTASELFLSIANIDRNARQWQVAVNGRRLLYVMSDLLEYRVGSFTTFGGADGPINSDARIQQGLTYVDGLNIDLRGVTIELVRIPNRTRSSAQTLQLLDFWDQALLNTGAVRVERSRLSTPLRLR